MSVGGVLDAAPAYALDPTIDLDALAERFARDGRVRIAPFLDEASAAALTRNLLARRDWQFVLNAGERVYDVPRYGPGAIAPDQEARLRITVDQAARDGFQFCFDSIRVPDNPAARRADDPLHALAAFLSSPTALALLRTITGRAAIAFADAQGTLYRAGDFLTGHDDAVVGKGRRAAYVLGLTPVWRTEWGGLLLFHDAEGDVMHGTRPRFNALNLFAVPQLHSVSCVARSAGAERLSVTGWLRARAGDQSG